MADNTNIELGDVPPPPTTKNLLTALAFGEIPVDETIRKLKDLRADCLDVLVTVLGAVTAMERYGAAQSFVDFTRLADAPTNDLPSMHRPPGCPVLLNGTMYDPCDITRFNGTALHFIPTRDYMIALNDRRVMAEYWRHTLVSSAAEQYQSYGSGFAGYAGPSNAVVAAGVQPAIYGPRGGNYGDNMGGGYSVWDRAKYDAGTTHFYVDHRFENESISLSANRGYRNLTKVGRGAFGLGDWNDVISSVSTMNRIVVLYEHVNEGGSTLTLENTNMAGSRKFAWEELNSKGWNDRASAVATW